MDGSLVSRLKAKDEQAYEILFRNWYPEAYRTAFLITHDRSLAEDVVQEAFYKVLRSVGTIREPDRLSNWLHVLVSRCAIDALRNLHGSQAFPSDNIAELVDRSWNPRPPSFPNPEEAAIAVERSESLMRALKSLPPVFRQVVVLFYYRGLSISEIAEAMQTAEGTVKSRLARARQRLAEVLNLEEKGRV